MTLIALRAGRLAVDLAPGAGGSIARFTVATPRGPVEVMRAATPEALAAGTGMDTACYPLVPFSNRIAEGRVILRGKETILPPNWPGLRHPMHGDGWSHDWTVERSGGDHADLAYRHDPASGWPFAYRAWQTHRLTPEALTVAIGIENLDGAEFPVGIGLHPFFLREPDTLLTCRTRKVWLADSETLPTTRIDLPAAWDFSQGRRVDDMALDNCFGGWDGDLSVAWPNRGLKLEMRADDTLRQLVIFIPPKRPYFCAEAVSNANNAFALHAMGVEDVGYRVLAPGESLSGVTVFRISDL